jgi:AcrR family transcriptional regulator
MEATGLEKGGLYRHFESREDLAAEAFKYALERVVKTRTGDVSHIHGSIAKATTDSDPLSVTRK